MSNTDLRKQMTADEFISQVIHIFKMTDFEIHVNNELPRGEERVRAVVKGQVEMKAFKYEAHGRSFGQALYKIRSQIREEFRL